MEIEEIHVQSDLIKVTYDNEKKILNISSDLNPKIIDENFNELDDRLEKVENKISMFDKALNDLFRSK